MQAATLKNNYTPRGKIIENAPLAKMTWFRVGGCADMLFHPADEDDLSAFLHSLPLETPVTMIGLASNMIIRDGGIRGVVIKLGKAFSAIDYDDETDLMSVGAGASDVVVSRYAAQNGLTGFEFLSGIPGGIGGAIRMNAGAYGGEVADIFVSCRAMDRDGKIHEFNHKDMGFAYRHCAVPEDFIFLSAVFKPTGKDVPEIIQARLDEIKAKREETQPVKDRTGGSTFANPLDGKKAWELVDAVEGRGLEIGGAKMSEKHCNFMLNTGNATAADLENLGEELRHRIATHCGVNLQWEIKRVGDK